jgi:hypothetical protein
MKPQQLVPSLAALDALTGLDALCCFVTEDDRPLSGATGYLDWRLCGALSKVLVSGFFVGAVGDRLLMPTEGRVPAQKVFAVGLGPSQLVTPLGLEHALTQAAAMLSKVEVASVALAFAALPPQIAGVCEELVVRAFAPHFEGAVAVFAAG